MRRTPGKVPRPAMERIMEKVAPGQGCWAWRGSTNRAGYAKIGTGSLTDGTRKMEYVTRLMLAAALGRPVGAGMFACHTCDNPRCVNPAHLFEGTPADNSADMAGKGRFPRGREHWWARLTEDQVRAIRDASGLQRDIGARYGVSQTAVSMIKLRKHWAHVS